MGGVQTTPCWRLLGVQQDDLITWTRTRSESESSEFVGFTLNDPMTALTTTSDLFPSTCQPVSLTLEGFSSTHVPYVSYHPVRSNSTVILPALYPWGHQSWNEHHRSDVTLVYLSVLCCFMTFVFVFYSCVERKNATVWYKSCSLNFRICQSSRDLSCMQMRKSRCAFFLFKNTVLMAPQTKPIFTPFGFFFSKICGLVHPLRPKAHL